MAKSTKIKKVKVSYRDISIRQIVLEDMNDIDNFFNENKKMNVLGLRKSFIKIISSEGKVLLSEVPHPFSGYHTWRTEGEEDYKILGYIN
jgi:hypothetical protein